MFKKSFFILLAATIVFAIAAPSALAGKANDTIVFAFKGAPESFDKYFNVDRMGIIMARHVWDNLIYRDPDTGEYKPLLATSYRFVNEKTMEFELRQGVKFHNGEEFDADDVVYTLNWVSNPDNKVKSQEHVNWMAQAERLGKYKVRLLLKKPFPAALEFLAGPIAIYPKDYYSKVGPDGMGLNPVGTGPYKVTQVKVGDGITMVKNNDYFTGSPKGKPNINKLVFKTIPEQNTMIAEILAGRVDFLWRVPADQAERLAKMPNITVKNAETMRIAYMQFDSANRSGRNSPINKVKVRRAIAHAIDRQKVVDLLLRGSSKVVHSACFHTQFGCTDDVRHYEYDPAKAKKLLAEAGYPNGFKMDFHAYRDKPVFEAIAADLKAVGIEVDFNYMKYSPIRDRVRNGQMDSVCLTWGSYGINDISAIINVFFTGGQDDSARDQDLIKWIGIADSSVDPKVRKELYKKSLQRIADQVYWLPLFSYNTFYAMNKELDFTPTPDEITRFFQAKWH